MNFHLSSKHFPHVLHRNKPSFDCFIISVLGVVLGWLSVFSMVKVKPCTNDSVAYWLLSKTAQDTSSLSKLLWRISVRWRTQSMFKRNRLKNAIKMIILFFNKNIGHYGLGLQRGGTFPETFQKSQEDSKKSRKVSEIYWKFSKFCNPIMGAPSNFSLIAFYIN